MINKHFDMNSKGTEWKGWNPPSPAVWATTSCTEYGFYRFGLPASTVDIFIDKTQQNNCDFNRLEYYFQMYQTFGFFFFLSLQLMTLRLRCNVIVCIVIIPCCLRGTFWPTVLSTIKCPKIAAQQLFPKYLPAKCVCGIRSFSLDVKMPP